MEIVGCLESYSFIELEEEGNSLGRYSKGGLK